MWRWRGGGELTETIHIIADYQLPALTLVHCADAQRIDLCNAVPTDLSMGGLGRVGWEGWESGGIGELEPFQLTYCMQRST